MKISQCLNPDCLYQNPANHKFCNKCGAKLLLGDRYRAIRYIGEGGFGRTFEAVDEHRLKTHCVIKQFLPLQQGSQALQKSRDLFEQEAEQLMDLGKHSQIPDLLAFFEQEGRLYLVQEFIDGQDLLKELKQKQRFSEEQVKQILINLLPVLQFIHEKKVIHRDIKPDNIIRQPNGNLFLIDFGVSKQLSSTVVSIMGTITGTIGYAAPEQMRGMVSAASDIYSLGVTAIRLLTGCLPEDRNGTFVDEIFDSIDMEWVWQEWLQKKGISVTNNLIAILDKMLQDKVKNRFQSAAEVLEALHPPQVQIPKVSTFSNSQVSSIQPSKLFSAGGFNYSQLDKLLANKNWKEADEETYRMMLKVARRSKEGWLTVRDIDSFPCEDLSIIDQLWLKYSNGRFGFSVQRRIWQEVGGRKTFIAGHQLSNRFRWSSDNTLYSFLILSHSASQGQSESEPVGHFPNSYKFCGGLLAICVLAARIARCNI